MTNPRPWLALVLLAAFATACNDGGVRREDNKFSIVEGSGFNADGPWRSWLIMAGGVVIDSRGTVTRMGRIGDDGARFGGVVTQSSDPSLIGATMVAGIRDGFPDKSTGLRIYTSGFDAQFPARAAVTPPS